MRQRFNDPVKAACYIGSGLDPEGAYAVTFQAGERTRSQICASREVVRTIEIFCRKFPQTSVLYYPEPLHGLIAEIHCHCDSGRRLDCCSHGEDRPRVFIRLAERTEATHNSERTCPDTLQNDQ